MPLPRVALLFLVGLAALTGLSAWADAPPLPGEGKQGEDKKGETKKGEGKQPALALDLVSLATRPVNEAALVTRLYEADRGSLTRSYPLTLAPARTARLRKFYGDWIGALKAVKLDNVSTAAREDLAQLRAQAEGELRDLEVQAAADIAVLPFIPFAETVIGLEEDRRQMKTVVAMDAAGKVDQLPKQIDAARKAFETEAKEGRLDRKTANRAVDAANRLRASLRAWHTFYNDYDPLFTWWVAHPYKQAEAALDGYIKFAREKAAGLSEAVTAPALKPTRVDPQSVATGPSDAPDLAALLARPKNEMVTVVQRLGGGRFGGGRGLGGGRGFGNAGTATEPTGAVTGGAVIALTRGSPGAEAGGSDPDQILAALAKIDFDKLSRDAQIDYILVRNRQEVEKMRRALGTPERPSVPKDDTGIVGRPIGRKAMMVDLAAEMIPYTPEELIALAKAELAWCESEIKKAAKEMGYGNDWRKAVEKVKTAYVPPGDQPRMIREQAVEAIEYLKARDLITIPPIAAETWRMAMMSPERQLVNPFFTGGETISVSYPSAAMSHEAKIQSMKGNNIPFARATVHHELIPGHHLQGYMSARENPHRSGLGTSFSTEGWALYWEFVLYDKGYAKTPEERIGFMVWRTHRCCRVIFSLGYHLGQMTPRQCVDFLVDRVGFEPNNAMAEVRRSFAGSYGPLYQAAYLLGGMQYWGMRKELVDTGKMTERAFHDAVIRQHRIPVAMARAALSTEKLTRDYKPNWKFTGPHPAVPAP